MEIFGFLLFIGVAVFFWHFRKGLSPTEEPVVREEPAIRIVIETRSYDSPVQDDEPESIDRDNWEGWFFGEASDPRPVRAVLAINYIDGGGQETTRTIEVREYDEELYGGCIIAFCRLRNATRTFRFDRVKSAIDTETGEVLDDVRIYLRGKYEASPAAMMDRLLDDAYDALRALLYLGKADGRLTAKEKAEILTFCHAVNGDTRLDMPTLERTFSQMDVPTTQAFKLCCGRLAKDLPDDQKRQIIDVAERMVATQKTVAAAEQEALDYLRKRLLNVRSKSSKQALANAS